MLLDDLVYYGQTKPRAARARCHIWLDQALALGRQPNAAVSNFDAYRTVGGLRDRHRDDCVKGFVLGQLVDCLDRVFHDIRQRLTQLPPVTDHQRRLFGNVKSELNAGMRYFVQEQRLAGDIDQILFAKHGFRHPRKR